MKISFLVAAILVLMALPGCTSKPLSPLETPSPTAPFSPTPTPTQTPIVPGRSSTPVPTRTPTPPPALVGAEWVVVQVPGTTTLKDNARDLLLVNADPNHQDKACTLPSNVPLESAPWTDIKTASIQEVEGGWVELSMVLQEPVPARPSYPSYSFVIYHWQFEGGCGVGQQTRVTDKDGVSVVWKGGKWEAYWGLIRNCDPREVVQGLPVDFSFSGETVRVRVRLEDLMLRGAAGSKLMWKADVGRVPFIWPPYTKTEAVDRAPEAPYWATWTPR